MARHSKPMIAPCAYCGVEEKLTIDHVIPECVFEKGKAPPGAPIVYACRNCNNTKKNLDDAYLRDILVADIDAAEHQIAQAIFHGPMMRAVKSQGYVQSPLAALLRRQEPKRVQVKSKSGIYLGDAFAIDVPMERLQRIFSTITRGLYLAYTDHPIPDGVQYTVHRVRMPELILETVEMLANGGGAYRQAGDGRVFQCVYGVASDRPDTSLWILNFYQKIIIAVETTNPALPTIGNTEAIA